MWKFSWLVVWAALGMFPATPSQADAPAFGVAGVPKALGETRDYDRIFKSLKQSGIDVFFPTFQYQEAPTVQTLGFETDFLVPCSSDAPAFKALRQHKMRLLVVGELLYPADSAMPPLSEDPLRQLIACAGRENVYGVVSYDEPAHTGTGEEAARRLYERVKQVDPSLPVLMIHAPIILDQEQHKTEEGRKAYLDAALRFSSYADIVGFDVYPVPETVALIGTPSSGASTAGPARAVRDYMEWLRRNLPEKKHLAVLQGFSYRDQFHPVYFNLIGSHVRSIVRAPSSEETVEMARIVAGNGASLIMWWGPSLLRDETSPPWPAILSVPKMLGALP